MTENNLSQKSFLFLFMAVQFTAIIWKYAETGLVGTVISFFSKETKKMNIHDSYF